MSDRETLIVAAAVLFGVLVVASMYGLHERHYRTRSERIAEARHSGHIEDRIACLEAILAEDRLT